MRTRKQQLVDWDQDLDYGFSSDERQWIRCVTVKITDEHAPEDRESGEIGKRLSSERKLDGQELIDK